MKSVRLLITLTRPLKDKLDALRCQGTTTSGFIRHLVEEHFAKEKKAKKRAA